MFPLRCSVRECDKPLRAVDGGLACENRHHFDTAKSGYISLLQPQDRKSLKPGDSDDAVLARNRWLERGHSQGLVDALSDWTEFSATPQGILDLGCGEGTFGHALFGPCAESYCGIDLSKRALRLAGQRWPEATWVMANADRVLPAADRSVGLVISLFGRRPTQEIKRVLTEDGTCLIAIPGEEDLIQLRQHIQFAGHRRNRTQAVIDEMNSAGLSLKEHRLWNHDVSLEPDAMADALAMTYRAVRHSQQTRIESLPSMTVTLAADLMQFGH